MMEETLCPLCGGRMVSRANKNTGQRFWGCKKYPECKGTRDTDGEISGATRPAIVERDTQMPSDRLRDNDRSRWRHQ